MGLKQDMERIRLEQEVVKAARELYDLSTLGRPVLDPVIDDVEANNCLIDLHEAVEALEEFEAEQENR